MHQLRACMLSCFSHVQLCQALAPWTVAFEALLSVGFSRQKYWSGLSCPPAGDLPNPGSPIKAHLLEFSSLFTETRILSGGI